MSLSEPWKTALGEQLGALKSASLFREVRTFEPVDAVRVREHGRVLRVFASNDYLGLSSHPRVIDATREAAAVAGNGSRGAALVCGHTSVHAELERRVAQLKGTETALLFPTGFAANVAAITALADGLTTIFSDELNHASIVDGCRLAVKNGARLKVYRHGDTDELATLLEADAPGRRKLIVTDSVFSMDGDLAPLVALASLKRRFGALLVVDDAHGTLVFGERGGGVPEELGVSAEVDVHVATLSKAVGACGGVVACNPLVREVVLNRGRTFVFSTALPIPTAAAALAALDAASDGGLRRRLWSHVQLAGEALGARPASPILPIVLGSEDAALAGATALDQAGFLVPAIRPPTVPPGTARLRVTISAVHDPADIRALGDAITQLTKPHDG